jgi:chromosome segregation ATPase
MTDKELKELVASLAISQKKTDEQIKATDEQIKELKDRMTQTDEQLRELKERMNQTDEQMKKTDIKIDKIAKMVGNMGNNQGEVAEEYFVNSLKDVLKIGELNFDYLLENVHLQTKKINDEFDILLVNGSSVAIIEVKYKVHPNVIDSLEKKIEHLKLMKEYKNYNIYAGVAGFKVPKEVIRKAEEKGYFVLKRKGDVIEEYIKKLIPA